MSNEKSTLKTRKVANKKVENKFIIQSSGKDYTVAEIKEICIKSFTAETTQKVESADIYIKVENGSIRAYYVINGIADGKYIDL